MRSDIVKKIISALCIIAFAALMIALIKDRNDETAYVARMEQTYNAINEKINELYTRRDELNYRIGKIRSEIKKQGGGQATVTFLLKEPDDDLIRSAKEVLDRNSCKADIAVSLEAFPGKPGCISLEDMKKMAGDGWGIVIAPEKTGDITEIAIEIGKAGLPRAKAVYLGAQYDPEEINDTIEQAGYNGIKVILADASLQIDEDADASVIRTEEYRADGIKDRTLSAIGNSDSIALAVGSPKQTEIYPYDEEVFSSMLSVINARVKTGECAVVSAGTAGERQERNKELIEAITLKEGTKIAQLEAEIEAINAQIHALHNDPDGVMAESIALPGDMAGAMVKEDGNPISRLKDKTKGFFDELKDRLYESVKGYILWFPGRRQLNIRDTHGKVEKY